MPDDFAGETESLIAEIEAGEHTSADPRDAELARLREELTQTRLELAQSDALRGAFVNQMIDVAGDIAKALGAIETAFHAGYVARIQGATSPDEAYRAWTEAIKRCS